MPPAIRSSSASIGTPLASAAARRPPPMECRRSAAAGRPAAGASGAAGRRAVLARLAVGGPPPRGDVCPHRLGDGRRAPAGAPEGVLELARLHPVPLLRIVVGGRTIVGGGHEPSFRVARRIPAGAGPMCAASQPSPPESGYHPASHVRDDPAHGRR